MRSNSFDCQVLDGSLDLALISFAELPGRGLTVHQLSDEQIAVVLPAGHRLADRRIRLAMLEGEGLLCLPSGTGIRTAFELSCRAVGL